MVGPSGINAMLITDHLPELRKTGVEGEEGDTDVNLAPSL